MTARPDVRDPGVRRILFAVMTTVTALVLLFGYRTSTSGAAGTATAAAAAATSSSGGTAAAGSRTYTGDAVSTRWGPVQVRITVSGGRVTGVDTVQVPDGNHRDVEINEYAVPVLEQEVLSAQSADVDTVSGATVTSDGYISSLQSALDDAGL